VKNLRRYRSLDEIRAVSNVDPTFGCWIADGSRVAISDTSKRPLAIDTHGKFVTLYRLAYDLSHDTPPTPGLVIDHRCRDNWCSRPLHLQAVTKDVNELLKVQRYRLKHATKCPRGHAIDDRTRLLSRRGGVLCRECVREDAKEFRP
jgi:HNH endonuclease